MNWWQVNSLIHLANDYKEKLQDWTMLVSTSTYLFQIYSEFDTGTKKNVATKFNYLQNSNIEWVQLVFS